MSAVQSISARELHSVDLKQALVVDVRSPMEYSEKRLAMPTAFAPVTDLDPRDVALRSGVLADTQLFTICRSGARAKSAAEKFFRAGYTNVRFIDGGIAACEEAGFATVGEGLPKTGEASPSLDRQVRLAAGALTVLFMLLGYGISPLFYLGALFIGAGQVFSGITNWCGMALLLMRAPWNQKGASCTLGGACSIGGNKGGGASPGASCQ
ncbi:MULTISPECIES: rhodanese-like domain-containing protein [Desulfovibrio]|uniref:Rhodanese-related sulfurtransferase n=2 Tax=Desulfovibrio TaxID=872 RepID=A0AA94HTT1_DESDE|nr:MULTISPECIES: rhodanese-like domain-containing protein [Desulfovibrio]ATD80782.1 sulfurtransferase [Desulfovibrio sp. G11]MDY0202521.1 rhodanese-like domain-containing protein [Desulfovibrio desulfuricans]SFW59961.1 Rhodanese-related sulfurtransferase [Desulfovibrio desulfuricans]SPD36325.1 Protein of unknown function (DUF2892) [Desulfovibrio sp. G11]